MIPEISMIFTRKNLIVVQFSYIDIISTKHSIQAHNLHGTIVTIQLCKDKRVG